MTHKRPGFGAVRPSRFTEMYVNNLAKSLVSLEGLVQP